MCLVNRILNKLVQLAALNVKSGNSGGSSRKCGFVKPNLKLIQILNVITTQEHRTQDFVCKDF